MTTRTVSPDETSAPDAPARAGGLATRAEDVVTVVSGAWIVLGAMSDGWAHVNIPELESFFTPWHGLLYAGVASTGAWTFWLAYRRRDRAPRWWRDAWPAGYAPGALGAVMLLAAGMGDMIWHTVLGIEIGIQAAFSPTHTTAAVGTVLLLSSPMRSWWASGEGGPRTVTGVLSAALATAVAASLLIHMLVFRLPTPTMPYDVAPGSLSRLESTQALTSYLITTVLLLIPLLLSHRRRTAPAATTLVGAVSLCPMVIFQFPPVLAAAAIGAFLGAATVDIALARLDATRGLDAPGRLPIAGALFAVLVWSGHLIGLHVAAGVQWPTELFAGVVVIAALLGALLGMLTMRPRA